MLSTIKKAAATADPIRFVVQSADAIQDGGVAAQLNVSCARLINRLMREGDVLDGGPSSRSFVFVTLLSA